MDEFILFIRFILITIISIALTVVILLKLENTSCNAIAKELGYKAHFGMFTGCILENTNGQKILLNKWRNFDYDR